MGARNAVENLYFPPTPKYIAAGTASYNLEVYERIVRVAATDATGDITVALPNAAEVPDKIFTVHLATFATSSVLVTDREGNTLATLDTSGDDVAAYSDGFQWILIGGEYT